MVTMCEWVQFNSQWVSMWGWLPPVNEFSSILNESVREDGYHVWMSSVQFSTSQYVRMVTTCEWVQFNSQWVSTWGWLPPMSEFSSILNKSVHEDGYHMWMSSVQFSMSQYVRMVTTREWVQFNSQWVSTWGWLPHVNEFSSILNKSVHEDGYHMWMSSVQFSMSQYVRMVTTREWVQFNSQWVSTWGWLPHVNEFSSILNESVREDGYHMWMSSVQFSMSQYVRMVTTREWVQFNSQWVSMWGWLPCVNEFSSMLNESVCEDGYHPWMSSVQFSMSQYMRMVTTCEWVQFNSQLVSMWGWLPAMNEFSSILNESVCEDGYRPWMSSVQCSTSQYVRMVTTCEWVQFNAQQVSTWGWLPHVNEFSSMLNESVHEDGYHLWMSSVQCLTSQYVRMVTTREWVQFNAQRVSTWGWLPPVNEFSAIYLPATYRDYIKKTPRFIYRQVQPQSLPPVCVVNPFSSCTAIVSWDWIGYFLYWTQNVISINSAIVITAGSIVDARGSIPFQVFCNINTIYFHSTVSPIKIQDIRCLLLW